MDLRPAAVDGFVFRTRNLGPFLPRLEAVRELETAVIDATRPIAHMRHLAREFPRRRSSTWTASPPWPPRGSVRGSSRPKRAGYRCGWTGNCRDTVEGTLMRHYPIFLDLRGKAVVVVGAGKVGLRKAKGLIEAGARVSVVSPAWAAEFDALPVTRIGRAFRPSDLKDACLAYAATNCREANRRVEREAKRRGIPVNVADDPGACDFIVPAHVLRPNCAARSKLSSKARSAPLPIDETRLHIHHGVDDQLH